MSIYASYTPGLEGGSRAAGRRVFMPWGGGAFDVSTLTSDGLTLLSKALQWAGQADTTAGAYTYQVQWLGPV